MFDNILSTIKRVGFAICRKGKQNKLYKCTSRTPASTVAKSAVCILKYMRYNRVWLETPSTQAGKLPLAWWSIIQAGTSSQYRDKVGHFQATVANFVHKKWGHKTIIEGFQFNMRPFSDWVELEERGPPQWVGKLPHTTYPVAGLMNCFSKSDRAVSFTGWHGVQYLWKWNSSVTEQKITHNTSGPSVVKGFLRLQQHPPPCCSWFSLVSSPVK